VDRDPGEPGQHPAGVDGVLTATTSAVVEGHGVGGRDVDPPQPARDPSTGLVEVRDRCRRQLLTGRGG